MNIFNAVASDLVEKRLWPVAAVLGAGAVAAPVAAHLTSSQPSPGTPPPTLQSHRSPASKVSSAAVQSLIAQLNPDAGVIPLRQGGFHDPFGSGGGSGSASTPGSPGSSSAAPSPSGPPSSSTTGTAPGGPPASKPVPVHLAPAVPVAPVVRPRPVSHPRLPAHPSPTIGSGVATPSQPSIPSHPSTPSVPSTPSSPTHTGTAPTTHTTPAKGPAAAKPHRSGHSPAGVHDTLQVYSASLRFGQAANVQSVSNPVRLSPLPSATDPEVVYLGVMKGGKRAAFLIPRTALGSGNGICRPSPGQCQVVELRVGDTEFLDIHSPTAGLVQYELDLTHIGSHHSTSRAMAAKAHRRESAAGRQLLRTANSTALAALNFSPHTGAVFVRSKPASAPAAKARTAPSPVSPPPGPGTPKAPPVPGVVPAPATPPQPAPAPHTGS